MVSAITMEADSTRTTYRGAIIAAITGQVELLHLDVTVVLAALVAAMYGGGQSNGERTFFICGSTGQ